MVESFRKLFNCRSWKLFLACEIVKYILYYIIVKYCSIFIINTYLRTPEKHGFLEQSGKTEDNAWTNQTQMIYYDENESLGNKTVLVKISSKVALRLYKVTIGFE